MRFLRIRFHLRAFVHLNKSNALGDDDRLAFGTNNYHDAATIKDSHPLDFKGS
jgi:hypothetical protein